MLLDANGQKIIFKNFFLPLAICNIFFPPFKVVSGVGPGECTFKVESGTYTLRAHSPVGAKWKVQVCQRKRLKTNIRSIMENNEKGGLYGQDLNPNAPIDNG
jgi:hypothetical protein